MSELKTKTIRGFIWSFIDLISKQGIQLLIQIILARLLLPEHFGVIGMITIFIAVSTAFVESGLDQSLIREKNPTDQDYSSVFYFNLIVSIFIYLLLFFLAPLISDFFNEDKLINVLRVVMLIVVINAFSIIQRVMLIRRLDFKTQTKISVISVFTSGFIAIILAYIGFGVWALVAQQLIMKLVEMILLILSNHWVPKLTFSTESMKKHFNFGYKLLISGLIDKIFKNIYFVIIGKLFIVTELGYYTNATKIRDTISNSLTSAVQKVTYPVLSQIQSDSDRLAANYKRLIKTTGYIFFPLMLGIFAIAPNLIPLLLGEKWIPSVPYFQLLLVAGMLYPIHAINLNILKVKNRSDLFLLLEIIKKILLSILITLAVVLDLGIEGLIYAAIINSVFSLIINTYYSAKEINYSFIRQLKDLLPFIIMSSIMAGLIVNINSWLDIGLFLTLLTQVLLGITIYICFSLLFRINEFYMILNLIKANWNKK